MSTQTTKKVRRRSVKASPAIESIVERIRARFAQDPHCAFYLRKVEVELSGRVLILRGCVPTERLKMLLPSLCGALDGVERIDNRVAVVSSSELSSP